MFAEDFLEGEVGARDSKSFVIIPSKSSEDFVTFAAKSCLFSSFSHPAKAKIPVTIRAIAARDKINFFIIF